MAYNDLTNMMMVNPWMFDPSQQSNQFSAYNNRPMPGPSYAGAPVNAATGQPIQSFLDWQAQNPGGVSLNATPAQPAQSSPSQWAINNAILNSMGAQANHAALMSAAQSGLPPAQRSDVGDLHGLMSGVITGRALNGPNPNAPGATGTPSAAPQGAGAAPNNWQAALSALANPGRVTTPGATVPMATGSQPSGGINAAFLSQAGPNMNQGFLSALRAIQGRPQ